VTGPRHKYDYAVRPDSAPARVIRMVGAGRRVLELGAGPGSITRHLHASGCRVTALELDEEALCLVAPFCEQAHQCNLNDPDWPALLADADKFDVIVAADIFEHLYDPGSALRRTLPLLAANGSLVVSLPHIGHNGIVACLLNSDFDYRQWGLLDSTHIRFFGLQNIQWLFADAGYKIVEAEFVVRSPEQTEFAYQWHKLSATVRAALAGSRHGNLYQVVIRAVPASAAGDALQLLSLPVPAPAAAVPGGDHSAIRRLLRRFGARLNPTTQARIVWLLRRIGLWPQSGARQ
jgi:2-polyprenyl-3-methyl-5-hydroxy-6-metoxy-1,4-benzoquinol methylase